MTGTIYGSNVHIITFLHKPGEISAHYITGLIKDERFREDILDDDIIRKNSSLYPLGVVNTFCNLLILTLNLQFNNLPIGNIMRYNQDRFNLALFIVFRNG